MRKPHSVIEGLPVDLKDKLHVKLPKAILEQLLLPPKTHDSQTELFRMAGRLFRAGFEEWERTAVLEAWFQNYYRPIDEREIERAVTRATGSSGRSAPKWPESDARRIAKLTAFADGGLEELKALSVPKPEELSTGAIIDRLFAPTDLLCFASSLPSAITDIREAFRGKEHDYQFIVPNPMSSKKGLTTDGHISTRCWANTGPLTYQVVEFDTGTMDEQAKIHLHLSRLAKLCLVVFSGNKSLHGWYDVRSMDPMGHTRFRRYVAALGADKATFTSCQLVRMPNARRDNGSIQTAIYLSSL